MLENNLFLPVAQKLNLYFFNCVCVYVYEILVEKAENNANSHHSCKNNLSCLRDFLNPPQLAQ